MRDAIVAEARSWIGTPYHHQGSLKGVSCDCIGLVRGVWRALIGPEPADMPANYSPDWAEASRDETMLELADRHLLKVPVGELAGIGDVLLFRWRPNLPAKHCAILSQTAGAGRPARIIHGYDAARRVAEVNLAEPWRSRIVAAYSFPGIAVGTGSPDRLASSPEGERH